MLTNQQAQSSQRSTEGLFKFFKPDGAKNLRTMDSDTKINFKQRLKESIDAQHHPIPVKQQKPIRNLNKSLICCVKLAGHTVIASK